MTTMLRCVLCFEGTEDNPCRHLSPEPAPPPAPVVKQALDPGADLSFDAPAAGTVVAVDPLRGLRSPHDPAPRWASQSRVVKFSRETGFDPWGRQAEILTRTADTDARVIVLCLGRRSGKDEMATTYALYEAIPNAKAHRAALQAGELFTVALIGNSNDQARDLMTTVKRKLQHPSLAPFVTAQTGDTVTLSTGARIRAYPCNARVIRGAAIAVAIWTEAAHSLDSEGRVLSTAEASEILSAVLPATAQFPHGRLIVSSTPKWSQGVFADLLAAGDDPARPEVIAFRYGTPEVNPRIPSEFFRGEAARNWAEYQREYLAIVTTDADAGVFDPDAVAAVVEQRDDLSYDRQHSYLISIDPAFRHDTFALVIGHLEGPRLIVDVVRQWVPGRRPLDPLKMADRVAILARAYGSARVKTDQAGADTLLGLLRERGVSATSYSWDPAMKQRAVDAATTRIWRGTVALPTSIDLAASLTGLEQKRSPGGTVRYEAARGAAPDDLAHAFLALCLDLDRDNRRVEHGVSPWA